MYHNGELDLNSAKNGNKLQIKKVAMVQDRYNYLITGVGTGILASLYQIIVPGGAETAEAAMSRYVDSLKNNTVVN